MEAVDTRGRLLRAADDPVAQVGIFAAQQIEQVAAVIDDEIRMARERRNQQFLIFCRGYAVDGIGVYAERIQTGRDVILRGERIAARRVYLRAAGCQTGRKIGRFRLHMDGHGDLFARKGLFPLQPAADLRQRRHEVLHPCDLHAAVFGKRSVFYNTHFNAPPANFCTYLTIDLQKLQYVSILSVYFAPNFR